MGRVIEGVKNDDGEVGQVKGLLGEGIFFNKTLISNEDEDNEKGNTIKSRAMGQFLGQCNIKRIKDTTKHQFSQWTMIFLPLQLSSFHLFYHFIIHFAVLVVILSSFPMQLIDGFCFLLLSMQFQSKFLAFPTS
jgi:hypothetical protein